MSAIEETYFKGIKDALEKLWENMVSLQRIQERAKQE